MFLSAFILLVSALLSGSLVLFFDRLAGKRLKLLLAFSGAYLLAVTFLDLIPEIYQGETQQVGYFILGGFFLQILLEFFSEGIEHGHIHVHHHISGMFPLAIMISLSLHAIIEGMPLYNQAVIAGNKSLFNGIILHNIPVSFALMSMFLDSGISKAKSFLFLFVFGLMTPIGMYLSAYTIDQQLFSADILTHYHHYILATVVGIFLHISTTILFESSEDHRFNIIKLSVIIAGIVVGIIL